MSNQDMSSILLDISERLVRVETKLDLLIDTNRVASDTFSLAQNYKDRLDKIDKIVFWAGTTIIGAVFLSLLGVIFI